MMFDLGMLCLPANEQVPRTMMATNLGEMPRNVKLDLGASSMGEHASSGTAPTAKTLNPFSGKLGPNLAAND